MDLVDSKKTPYRHQLILPKSAVYESVDVGGGEIALSTIDYILPTTAFFEMTLVNVFGEFWSKNINLLSKGIIKLLTPLLTGGGGEDL